MNERLSGSGRRPSAQAERGRIIRGILLMCTAALLFPLMNGFAKVLIQHYHPTQIVWARNAGHLLFLLAIFVPRIGLARLVRCNRPLAQMVISLLLLVSTAMMFVSLEFLPLANASAIIFTAPLIVTVLSVALLKEGVGPARWLAVLAGFAGMLIVMRPGTALFHWATFLVLGSAATYALYQIMMRRIAGLDTPETTATYSVVLSTFLMSLVVPFFWKTPETLAHLGMFLGMGMLGGISHYFIAQAMALAPASTISPFNYTQILGAIVFDYLVFATFPDLWTWVGAAVIAGSGIYLLLHEARADRAG
ncbi:MAG: DMT family transporter [Reyranellaceae bacterium]